MALENEPALTPLRGYHSWPRGFNADRPGIDEGLSRLESMVAHGLLLTFEPLPFSEPLGDDLHDSDTIWLRQKRICFTMLDEWPTLGSAHARHATMFGPFALEFDPATLQRLGALPAAYIDLYGPEGIGRTLLARLGDVQSLLALLARQEASAGQSLLTGLPDGVELEDLEAAMRIAVSHYARLGPDADAGPTFFPQREWRICSGAVFPTGPIARELSEATKEALLTAAPDYWGHVFEDSLDQPKRRVDLTQAIKEVPGTAHVLNLARRVLVPADALVEAKYLLADLDVPAEAWRVI